MYMDPRNTFHNPPTYVETHTRKRRLPAFIIGLLIIGSILLVGLSFFVSRYDAADQNFPLDHTVTIAEGMTVRDITDHLEREQVVRSSLYLYILLQLDFDDAYIQAGTYAFTVPLTAHEVASAITQGDFVALPPKVTFPEGFKAADLHEYLPENYATASLEAALPYDGYLFPDTYFIQEGERIDDIVAELRANYETHIAPLRPSIEASGFTEAEIIILASIIEREGKSPESMHMVAGILKHRLAIDMPLQVDATFEYLLGKASHELTTEDLAIDSPYNTYTNRGLPPTPIANPGITAITAAIEAEESSYLYYLTGNDGEFYYAHTFEEHKQNKARYLR